MGDITHIERSNLPWQTHHQTECGLDADRHPTWTRDQAVARCKELGQQRFALFVCMTCWHTAQRHLPWEIDPASCMARHAHPVWATRDGDKHRRMNDELRAIAILVDRHRGEFDALVSALAQAPKLQDARARRRVRGRLGS